MKERKNLVFGSISILLGIVCAVPNNELSSVKDISFLLAEALGYIIGGYIVAAALTLIFSIFDRSILKRFLSVSILTTMIILIPITLVRIYTLILLTK